MRSRLAHWIDPDHYRQASHLQRRYDLLWRDHLTRCNCHDSWDQCPCTERGHTNWGNERHVIAECANSCCRWCSGEELP
jgi:hypothetical protein